MVNELRGHEVDTYEWNGVVPGVMDYDWVIHIGGISSTTETDVEKILTQNLDFSIALYDQCKTFGVNFQYSSSASVYGRGTEFNEESPVDPRTPYAWSKYLFERHVRKNPSGAIVQGFRYFNVYGPGEEHKGNQASPFTQFTKQAIETGKIKVFEGSSDYKRDFVHVKHVVEYHKMFLHVKESGVFNIGSGIARSFLDVAEEVAHEYGAKIEYVPMPENLKNSYQSYTQADMTKTIRAVSSVG